MNAKEFIMHQCENCGMRHFEKERAEKCCYCIHCGKPKGHKYGNLDCENCKKDQWRQRDIDKENKAKLIKYDPKLVYHDNNENWLYDDDCLYDYLDSRDDDEIPEHLFVSERIEFNINAEDIIENAIVDEHHEDAMDDIAREETRKLQKYLDKWCEEQNISSWSQSMKQKVSVKEIIKNLK
ncbi:hypothetical protein KAR91_40705 [Candidatus Pacearchaeota archaeon]|nr:hypothetical protein [Candidatus Pacearchaeota archaeon]